MAQMKFKARKAYPASDTLSNVLLIFCGERPGGSFCTVMS